MKLTLEARRLIREGWRRLEPAPPAGDAHPSFDQLAQLKRGDTVRARMARVRRVTAKFSEADLIAAMQTAGVGRPATYAHLVPQLVERKLVKRTPDGALEVTALGERVWDFLSGAYPELFTPAFTASLEANLDAIADGRIAYTAVLADLLATLHT